MAFRIIDWGDAPVWADRQARNLRPTVDCIYWIDGEGYQVVGTDKKIKYTDDNAYQLSAFLIISDKPTLK